MIRGSYLGVPDRAPVVELQLDWVTASGESRTCRCLAVLDTGASKTIVYKTAFWSRVNFTDADLPAGRCTVAIGGVAHGTPVEVRFMDHRHAGVEDALLGQDVLSDYVASFDGPAGRWSLSQ